MWKAIQAAKTGLTVSPVRRRLTHSMLYNMLCKWKTPSGHLATCVVLGSRLKRLGERLQADVAWRWAGNRDSEVQAGQFPNSRDNRSAGTSPPSPTSPPALGGQVSPGVTRNVAGLVAAGLVQSRRIHEDQRHKRLTLTKAGKQLVARCKRGLPGRA